MSDGTGGTGAGGAADAGGATTGGATDAGRTTTGGAAAGEAVTDGGAAGATVDGAADAGGGPTGDHREQARLAGALARYEAGRRLRGTLVLTGLFVALAALDLAAFPSIEQSGVDLDEYLRNLPPVVRAAFGDVSLGTIEGFLVAEFYQFAWVLAFGLYLAYRAGGLVAGDVERDRMDLLLSTPISRPAVVVGKYLSLVPAMVVANAVVAAVVYAGVRVVGESLSAADLLAVHLLSLPYLLACAGVGILASTVASTADAGQRAGMGVVLAMYLLESIAEAAGIGPLRALAFQRYYDTAPVLTEGEYDLAGAAVLLAAAAALLGAAAWWFSRRDVT